MLEGAPVLASEGSCRAGHGDPVIGLRPGPWGSPALSPITTQSDSSTANSWRTSISWSEDTGEGNPARECSKGPGGARGPVPHQRSIPLFLQLLQATVQPSRLHRRPRSSWSAHICSLLSPASTAPRCLAEGTPASPRKRPAPRATSSHMPRIPVPCVALGLGTGHRRPLPAVRPSQED